MAKDRYNNLNNTAPEVDPTKQKKPKVEKSDFNLGRCVYFRAMDGMIIPFDCFHVLPNSSHELRYDFSILMANPYVRELLTGKRAYVHVYHSNFSDLWEGADELLKKGRDFATQYKIPTLNRFVKVDNDTFDTFTAGSPACYLGLPVSRYDNTKSRLNNIKPIKTTDGIMIENYDNLEISALPLVMFQQIYQSSYMNKNLVNSNTKWLPTVENHFILPLEASGESVSQLSYDINTAKSNVLNSDEDFSWSSDYFVPSDKIPEQTIPASNSPFLNAPRFRQFKGDMINSGSPFADLMRGDVPVMSFSDLTGTINWEDVFATQEQFISGTDAPGQPRIRSGESDWLYAGAVSGGTPTYNSTATDIFKNALSKAVVTVQNQLSFNLNALRALDVYTLLGERAARTDGTYNSYIQTMFGVRPNKHMHEPRYLGGFYLDFANMTVTQQSQTDSTPLGTQASRGYSKGDGYIGKFSFNDHGYVMAVLDIVEETVYTGGVDRDWTDLTFDQQYLPLFNGLAPQATLQQELHINGVKADNEDVFNYVERYSHLKSRRNKALGQMSLPAYVNVNGTDTPVDLESTSFLHTRHFKEKVEFNNKFVTMSPDNLDWTPYSQEDDYPYICSVYCHNEAILPLPYITVPSGLSIMA